MKKKEEIDEKIQSLEQEIADKQAERESLLKQKIAEQNKRSATIAGVTVTVTGNNIELSANGQSVNVETGGFNSIHEFVSQS